VGKSNRKLNLVYSEEREGKTKDANGKLKSQIKRLTKTINQLESENRTLTRAFNKSCDYIQRKLDNRSLEEILEIINDFDYKETNKGAEAVEKKAVTENKMKKEVKKVKHITCPKCSVGLNEGYKIIDFRTFVVETCECGHRSRTEKSERVERD
jgi:hypothetical protein